MQNIKVRITNNEKLVNKNKLKEEVKMKLFMKGLFLLILLVVITFKIIGSVNLNKKGMDTWNSIKDNFSGDLSGRLEWSGFGWSSGMTTTTFGMHDNSCSMPN